MLLGVAVVAIGAVVFYLSGGRYQSTDDAYIRVATVSVSSNIAGRVTNLYVHENQRVRAGEVMFTLDPEPLNVAVEQASAQLANARQSIQASQATLQQRQVELQTAQQTLVYRERDKQREYNLMKAGAVSQAEYDEAAHQADLARQQIAVVRQQIASAQAQLGGGASAPLSQQASVRQAAADVARAQLTRSYGIIRAPQDGIVTRVENLQVGDYINASAPVFNLVLDEVWVEGAFKENQLTYMRPGQAATVKIDAFPGQIFPAQIASLSPGTDQTFSALPAENASGNWVKVVQRVPVRLHFTRRPNVPLVGGVSASVKVDTHHERHLFGAK